MERNGAFTSVEEDGLKYEPCRYLTHRHISRPLTPMTPPRLTAATNLLIHFLFFFRFSVVLMGRDL